MCLFCSVRLRVERLLIHTPPQARLVGNRKTEVRRELLQLVGSQGLREDVGRLQVGADML